MGSFQTPTPTGTPQGGGPFQIDLSKYLGHKFYGETNANPADVTGTMNYYDEGTGRNVTAMRTRGGQITNPMPASRNVEWLPTQIPNIFQAYTAAGQAIPGMVRQGPGDYNMERVTNPDGSQSFQYLPKNPAQAMPGTGAPQPGAAAGGMVKLELDPSKLTQADIDGLTSKLKGMLPGANGGSTRPSLTLGRPGMQASPGSKNLPIKEDDMPFWIHKDTLTSPWEQDTPENLKAAGYKRVSPDQRKIVDARNNLFATIQNVKEKVDEVWGTDDRSLLADRTTGAIGRLAAAHTQSNPAAAVYMSQIYPVAVEAVRAFGEVGNISGPEQAGAKETIPKLTDSRETALAKIGNLEKWANSKLQTLLYGREAAGPSGSTQGKTQTGPRKPSLQLNQSGQGTAGGGRFRILKVE